MTKLYVNAYNCYKPQPAEVKNKCSMFSHPHKKRLLYIAAVS